jgi:hypothetical protein
MAYTRIYDTDFNFVYQLRDGESLTDTYLDVHPLGRYWTDPSLNGQQFTAVTTADDGTHTYQVISAVPGIVTCACGHPKGTASWTALS